MELSAAWRLASLDGLGARQPEREVARLHRLIHHRQQVLAQAAQVHLVA
ncbi:MAG TPA: hypothetical protein VID73_08170 [Ktedonobacterales bacterium]